MAKEIDTAKVSANTTVPVVDWERRTPLSWIAVACIIIAIAIIIISYCVFHQ